MKKSLHDVWPDHILDTVLRVVEPGEDLTGRLLLTVKGVKMVVLVATVIFSDSPMVIHFTDSSPAGEPPQPELRMDGLIRAKQRHIREAVKGLQPLKQLLRGNRGKGITAYYRPVY